MCRGEGLRGGEWAGRRGTPAVLGPAVGAARVGQGWEGAWRPGGRESFSPAAGRSGPSRVRRGSVLQQRALLAGPSLAEVPRLGRASPRRRRTHLDAGAGVDVAHVSRHAGGAGNIVEGQLAHKGGELRGGQPGTGGLRRGRARGCDSSTARRRPSKAAGCVHHPRPASASARRRTFISSDRGWPMPPAGGASVSTSRLA